MYDGEANGRTVAQLETGMEIPPPTVEVDVLLERIAALEGENARLRAFAESIEQKRPEDAPRNCWYCGRWTLDYTDHAEDCLYLRAQAALNKETP